MKTNNRKGKLISSWSGFGHKNGNTTFSILLAYMLSDLFPNKNILLMDMNYRFALLEKIVSNQASKGIDNLLNVYCTDKITKQTFCDCLSPVKKRGEDTNIYNLSASKNRVFNNNNESGEASKTVLTTALEIFDIVIVDNSAGTADVLNLVNKEADLVLSFLTQNKYVLDYMRDINVLSKFNEDKFINIVNKYDEVKGISLDYISKNYKMKNLRKIPRNLEFTFYLNNGSLYEIIEEDYDYKRDLENLTIEIIEKLGIDTSDMKPLTDRGNLFKRIKSSLNFKRKKVRLKEGGA